MSIFSLHAPLRRTVVACAVALGMACGASAASPTPAVAQEGASTSADALITKAGAALKKRNYTQAVALYNEALLKDPKAIKAYEGLGRAWRVQKDWDKAIRTYNRGLKAVPDWDRAHYLLGYAHRKAGNLDAAIEAYTAYSERVPDDPDTYYGLGSVYVKADKPREAIATFETYIQKEKRPKEQKWVKKAQATIAKLKADLGDDEPAAAPPAATPDPAPKASTPSTPPPAPSGANVAALVSEGDAAMASRDYDNAAVLYARAAAADTTGTEAHYKLGATRAVLGDLPGAIEAWETVTQRDPSMKAASRNLKRARAKLADLRQQGIDDPALSDALGKQLGLAADYLNNANAAMALRVLDPLAMSTPDDARVRLLRGRALMALGRYDEARRDLDLALGQRPGDADVLFAVGQNALHLGQNARARYFLGRYLERVDPTGRDPSHDTTRAALKRLTP